MLTTLIAWISFDQKQTAGFYLASDSRITWGSRHRRWDAGRKLFACQNSPDLFGYSGDVIFPALALGQVVGALDHSLLTGPGMSARERNEAAFSALQNSYRRRHLGVDSNFTIFHAAREGERRPATFLLWRIDYHARRQTWTNAEIQMPDKTSVVATAGSGGAAVRRHTKEWIEKLSPGVSRAIFSGFCALIDSEDDPLSGGAPQLVGLYPQGNGREYGIVYRAETFLHGLPLPPQLEANLLEWRDPLFQRMDPTTLQPISGAQRHAAPRAKGLVP